MYIVCYHHLFNPRENVKIIGYLCPSRYCTFESNFEISVNNLADVSSMVIAEIVGSPLVTEQSEYVWTAQPVTSATSWLSTFPVGLSLRPRTYMHTLSKVLTHKHTLPDCHLPPPFTKRGRPMVGVLDGTRVWPKCVCVTATAYQAPVPCCQLSVIIKM